MIELFRLHTYDDSGKAYPPVALWSYSRTLVFDLVGSPGIPKSLVNMLGIPIREHKVRLVTARGPASPASPMPRRDTPH